MTYIINNVIYKYMSIFNFINRPLISGLDSKKRGIAAKKLMIELCNKNRIPCRSSNLEEDCGGGKTDVVVKNKRVQIKSKRQQKSLEKKGVIPLAVGGKSEKSLVNILFNI